MKSRLSDDRRWPPTVLWCPACLEYSTVRNTLGYLVEHRCFRHRQVSPSLFMSLATSALPPAGAGYEAPRAPLWR